VEFIPIIEFKNGGSEANYKRINEKLIYMEKKRIMRHLVTITMYGSHIAGKYQLE